MPVFGTQVSFWMFGLPCPICILWTAMGFSTTDHEAESFLASVESLLLKLAVWLACALSDASTGVTEAGLCSCLAISSHSCCCWCIFSSMNVDIIFWLLLMCFPAQDDIHRDCKHNGNNAIIWRQRLDGYNAETSFCGIPPPHLFLGQFSIVEIWHTLVEAELRYFVVCWKHVPQLKPEDNNNSGLVYSIAPTQCSRHLTLNEGSSSAKNPHWGTPGRKGIPVS